MNLEALTAISPIDGRYREQVKGLAPYFSEFALIKYRVLVEVEYFIALCELPLPELKDFDRTKFAELRGIYEDFNPKNAAEIKETEKITNHDVKAVEYFLKKHFSEIESYSEFIHFGLTSQDINNTSVPMMLRDALQKEVIPAIKDLISSLKKQSQEWKDIPMLARTHGQPASPTRLGKELMVFVERLEKQVEQVEAVPFSAKFGGATGNFNAHHITYPEIDWIRFANDFVEKKLGLKRSQFTTQIEHYDNLASLFDGLKRINTILIDLSRDIWQYISMNYFTQRIKEGEVGSSAMPHKVNPIDFENAEGNLGVANSLFEHFSAKLPISRLQRDLTDSTVLRNVGVPISHTFLALKAIQKGLGKLQLNEVAINNDLDENWAVLAEAIQTILRREGYPKPYEALKDLTRKNEKITSKTLSEFIDGLNVNEEVRKKLRELTPFNYTGINLL